jgi:hypothetical protein
VHAECNRFTVVSVAPSAISANAVTTGAEDHQAPVNKIANPMAITTGAQPPAGELVGDLRQGAGTAAIPGISNSMIPF